MCMRLQCSSVIVIIMKIQLLYIFIVLLIDDILTAPLLHLIENCTVQLEY